MNFAAARVRATNISHRKRKKRHASQLGVFPLGTLITDFLTVFSLLEKNFAGNVLMQLFNFFFNLKNKTHAVKSPNILFKFLRLLKHTHTHTHTHREIKLLLLLVYYHLSRYSYNQRRENCNADLSKSIYISVLYIFQECGPK